MPNFCLIVFQNCKFYMIFPGVYNQRKTTAPPTATAAPPYSSGGNLIPSSTSASSQPPSLVLTSNTTPLGPILPLAPYELKHPTMSSGISQPLSSLGKYCFILRAFGIKSKIYCTFYKKSFSQNWEKI